MAKRWPDEQEADTRRCTGVRWPNSSKSKTCTGRCDVYGFRPGRNAQQAVTKAAQYIRGGKCWVLDMDNDLEKFFDRVNHDVLLARVAREVQDANVLRLIRKFLQAGMMAQRGRDTTV
jgi:retron-type reverse transcriptase